MFPCLFVICVLAISCRREQAPALEGKSPPSLEGTHVTVALNRSALGVSTSSPLSRQTGTYNGVEVSVSGYVAAETERFLVLSDTPVAGHDVDHDLHWFPLTSILSIRQSKHRGTSQTDVGEDAPPWRLEAVQNLLGMVAFPLKDLPQGELELWFEQDGKKEYLDGVDTTPGFDRWLQIGVDPVNSSSLIVSFVSEEDRGFGLTTLPTKRLTPLHKTIKPGHNWRVSAVIAAEGSGDGKIHARVKPKQ